MDNIRNNLWITNIHIIIFCLFVLERRLLCIDSCAVNSCFYFVGFLEVINNMLTIGMVPALFTDEEKDGITGQVRNAAKEEGYGLSK